ncbi:MAG TPA: hypothetical protein VF576_05870 [Rubricoccaceae bacterium]|jgi:hypothetical protein
MNLLSRLRRLFRREPSTPRPAALTMPLGDLAAEMWERDPHAFPMERYAALLQKLSGVTPEPMGPVPYDEDRVGPIDWDVPAERLRPEA